MLIFHDIGASRQHYDCQPSQIRSSHRSWSTPVSSYTGPTPHSLQQTHAPTPHNIAYTGTGPFFIQECPPTPFPFELQHSPAYAQVQQDYGLQTQNFAINEVSRSTFATDTSSSRSSAPTPERCSTLSQDKNYRVPSTNSEWSEHEPQFYGANHSSIPSLPACQTENLGDCANRARFLSHPNNTVSQSLSRHIPDSFQKTTQRLWPRLPSLPHANMHFRPPSSNCGEDQDLKDDLQQRLSELEETKLALDDHLMKLHQECENKKKRQRQVLVCLPWLGILLIKSTEACTLTDRLNS